MSHVFSYMVTRNEAERYLAETVSDLVELTDGCLVYDDCSDDDTMEIARDFGALPIKRHAGIPSFLEDESAFRQAAWRSMEEIFRPEPGDWILTLDADEIVFPYGRSGLDMVIAEAISNQGTGVIMRVREMWNPDMTHERIDGFWGSITALRLVAWRPDGQFLPNTQGGGSVPFYDVDTRTLRAWQKTNKLEIHHFGYARQEDREAKYARYSQHPGHNKRHIASILQDGILKEVA